MENGKSSRARSWAMEPPSSAGASPEIDHLWRHVTGSYHTLRLGMGIVGVALPLVLWWGGWLIFSTELKASMSAYYWTSMRNVFVGLLFAVGALLYLYKGFSPKENVALNLAGFSALGVALVPEGTSKIHGVCAVFLFLCIAYVSIFRSNDTLKYVLDANRKARYTHTYRILGVLMIALPLTAFILISALQVDQTNKNVTFAVEFAGIWAFAAFWLVKGREIKRTQRDAEEPARGEVAGAGPEAMGLPPGPGRPAAKASAEARFLA
jgi:hypothetical protein